MRVTGDLLANAQWRKSSYSNAAGGDCVEVAVGHDHSVPVRDSKRPAGPTLRFPGSAWATFIGSVKHAGAPHS